MLNRNKPPKSRQVVAGELYWLAVTFVPILVTKDRRIGLQSVMIWCSRAWERVSAASRRAFLGIDHFFVFMHCRPGEAAYMKDYIFVAMEICRTTSSGSSTQHTNFISIKAAKTQYG